MKLHTSIRHFSGRLLATVAVALLAAPAARADYQSTVLSDTPLAYYPLNLDVDTGSTATDLSGNNNPGTYVNIYSGFNNVPGPSPFITNGISFDGLTTLVDLSTGSNLGLLNFSGPITLEAWVQPAAPSVFGNIIAKGYDGANNNFELQMRANNGNYTGGTYGPADIKGASGGVETTNWTYVVLTHDGTNWRIYVDGVMAQQNPDPVGAINFSAPWAIGTGTQSGANRLFTGNLSQVAMYNFGLSSNQVLNHFFVGKLGTTAAASRPMITTQPQPQSNYFGSSVTFSVGVLSALPTTNQWFKGASPLLGKTNATLTLSNVGPGDVASYSVRVGNSNGTTNSAAVSFTLLSPGATLRWNGTGNSNVWDTATTPDWINTGNSQPVVFNTGDQVLFDDTVGVATNAGITGTVSASVITVNSANNNFTISGPGTITGPGSLVKSGPSTLTLFSGGNFTGPVSINGGSIYAGNNAFASVSSVTVANNATLDLGGGTFTGNKPITLSGYGVNGIGALFNSYPDYPVQTISVTLAADASFGASQRWDLGAGSFIGGPHSLLMNWTGSGYSEWTQPTIGADVVNITVTNGNFGAKNMDNSFLNPATMFTISTNCQFYFWSGNWNGSFHLLSGSQVNLWTSPGLINGSTVILENNSQWGSWGGSGDVTVNNAVVFNGIAHLPYGDHNMIYTNVLSGTGGFVADIWNHAMVLSSSNTYSGPTILGDGPQIALVGKGSITHSSLIFFGGANSNSVHVDVTGRPDQTFTLASGQTLAGIGAVNGNLTVSPGATITPAGTNSSIGINTGSNPLGTLSANNVTLSGTTVIKLSSSGLNDTVNAGGTITYGGTLNLAIAGGAPLLGGTTYQIFNATTFNGSFGSITPATPGPGQTWDISQLNTGKITVVGGNSPQPIVSSVKYSAGSLILSGSNGVANAGYYVLTSTNVAASVLTWLPVATNNFDANGAFSVTNAVTPGTPQRFYILKLQ